VNALSVLTLFTSPALAGELTRPDREGSFWLPPAASTIAADIDFVWWYILILDVVFFVILMGAMVGLFVKYRQRREGEPTADIKGSHTLELVWAAVPSVFLVAMFWFGFKGWMDYAVPPADSMEVRVLGQKWDWNFQYTDTETGKSFLSPELKVPSGKPVKLVMQSQDVLHSFYVPDFRIKRDVVPNRYTVIWFEAPHEGVHDVFCTEYCGDGHSKMIEEVTVMDPQDYRSWAQDEFDGGGTMTGEKLYAIKGCQGCHSVDGSVKVGPSFQGLYGKQESLADGTTVKVDDDYIRESINVPAAKIVAGFAPSMPPYQGQLSDEEINLLIDYIKNLSE
jgi:cytochrome c oxidase subunit 2